MFDATDGLDGGALWRSGEPGFCAFDEVIRSRNGVLDPDASGELDAEVQ